MEGAERIMLGSNNYLGLTGDERVLQGARDALEQYGTGLTGSRLLNGTIPLHLELERELAEWMGTEDAIVFTTGHQANVGTLGTILAPGDTVIADSGDHASILDGCLLSRAKLRPFRHNRLDKLEKMLERARRTTAAASSSSSTASSRWRATSRRCPRSSSCARRYGARLMVDEAHGAGVLGARGAGTAELLGVEDRVDLRMGTFSKSLASCGGFIAGSPRSSTSCASSRARSSSPPRPCPPRSAPRSPRCGSCAPTRAAAVRAACSTTRATSRTACTSSASA